MNKHYRIDLFSDTNTEPSPSMRAFMCQAAVGNEVAGEDPTVNYLLERVCTLLGKESAVFLPSGTMCNGIAYRVLCQRPGDLIILDKTAHPLLKGAGLISGLVHASPYSIHGNRGIFSAQDIEPVFNQPRGFNTPFPRVVSIEQTTNFGGGAIWPFETLKEVCDLAHSYNAFTHLDGARLLNAVSETGITASQYASLFDSVWIDFSKSLGACMGAVLAGSKEFIEEAWYYKFQQGGAMHQVGIMAASCLYALEHNFEKIKQTHQHAKELAHKLSHLPFVHIDLAQVETNILLVTIVHSSLTAPSFEILLKKEGIRVLAINKNTLRLITHLDITHQDIQDVFKAIEQIGQSHENG